MQTYKILKVSQASKLQQTGRFLEIIDNLTLDVAQSIGIARRTFFDLKKKASSSAVINLKGKTLRKLRQLQFEDKQEGICKS